MTAVSVRRGRSLGLRLAVAALVAIAPLAAATTGSASAGAASAESAGFGSFPDPAPAGPTHPSEPNADGPANLDTLDVDVRRAHDTTNGVAITFDRRSRTASGEKPAAPRRFVFLFDKSIRFDPEHFPTCAREVLETEGFDACDPESVVGIGRVETYGQDGAVDVKVFNTEYDNGHRGVLITIPATGAIFENTLEPVSWPYRSNYGWAFDEMIIPAADIPPEDRPASSRFTVEFGATRQVGETTYNFAETTDNFAETRAPRAKPLQFGLWSHFVTGQIILPSDQARALY